MESTNMSEFKEKVSQFFNLDKELKNIQNRTKQLKKDKKELETYICEFMAKNEIQETLNPDGKKITMSHKKTITIN